MLLWLYIIYPLFSLVSIINKFLDSLFEIIFALFNLLIFEIFNLLIFENFNTLIFEIFNDTSLYNNSVVYVGRKEPEDEDLESEADDLGNRNSHDENLRKEAKEKIKRTYGFDPDGPGGE